MIQRPPKVNTSHYLKAIKVLENKKHISSIDEINNKYLYWDKVKYHPLTKEIEKETLWASLKIIRGLGAKQISLGTHTFSFHLTNYMQQQLHELDLNIGGTMGSEKLLPQDEKQKYLVSSIMEEAIASSQMEGAVTTRKKAKEMLRKNNNPRSKSEQMILNNYRTIKHIVENKNKKLTPERLLEVHQLMTKNTLNNPKDEGSYRSSNDVYVINEVESEVVHTPPCFTEIPERIKEICNFFNKDDSKIFVHPIVKGIIIHFFIGYLHPFVDGNGRTARALFYWYLLSKGYWLTEYLSISRMIIKSKTQYEKAYLYTENDDNDLNYFLHYNIKTMTLAYESLKKYLRKKIEEKRYVTNFQRHLPIGDRQADILKWFYDEPELILTVKEVETRLSIANQTARNDLNQLAKLGFIEILQANQKKQVFIKSNNFEELIKSAKD